MKKSFTMIALISLLIVLITEVPVPHLNVEAGWSGETIYIRADGSIEPGNAPIRRDGETYVLTDDVEITSWVGIIVVRDNVMIDGNRHVLRGKGYGDGVYLVNRRGVTVKNFRIQNFYHGIYIGGSSSNKVVGNDIENNMPYGIYIYSSSNNEIVGNDIENNNQGIYLDNSSGNKIFDNNIKNHWNGISLFGSSNNKVAGNKIYRNKSNGLSLDGSTDNEVARNDIENNGLGISVLYSSNNKIYINNFTNNAKQVLVYQSVNVWDDGSKGNCWSDYDGLDLDNDGIGDSPYVIDDENRDNYPLVRLYLIFVNVLTPYGTARGSGWYVAGARANISTSQTIVDQGNRTRRVFKGWFENNALISEEQSLSIIVDKPRTLVIGWDTEYEVIVATSYGVTNGSSWYKLGGIATISIYQTVVDHGNGTRRVFKVWFEKNSLISDDQRFSITVDRPRAIVAVWYTEYEVKVASERGMVTGSGWYSVGSTATVSINPTTIEGDSLFKYVFEGWKAEGNFVSTSLNYSFAVDKPVDLVASWRTEMNFVIVGLIVGVLLVITMLTVLIISRRHGSLSSQSQL